MRVAGARGFVWVHSGAWGRTALQRVRRVMRRQERQGRQEAPRNPRGKRTSSSRPLLLCSFALLAFVGVLGVAFCIRAEVAPSTSSGALRVWRDERAART